MKGKCGIRQASGTVLDWYMNAFRGGVVACWNLVADAHDGLDTALANSGTCHLVRLCCSQSRMGFVGDVGVYYVDYAQMRS